MRKARQDSKQSDHRHGDQAYRKLIDAIARGELLPGTRLRETDLSERLGLSRTPVREALRALEADGLVSHQPRLGAVVRELDHAEVMELYEMRAVMEGTAARLAARIASDVELQALAALNSEFASCPDPAEAARLNRRFHQDLLGAARNRFLARAMAGLEKTMLILGPTTMMLAARIHTAAEEHGTLLAALERRDGSAAEAAMRAHIEAAQLGRLHLRSSVPRSHSEE